MILCWISSERGLGLVTTCASWRLTELNALLRLFCMCYWLKAVLIKPFSCACQLTSYGVLINRFSMNLSCNRSTACTRSLKLLKKPTRCKYWWDVAFRSWYCVSVMWSLILIFISPLLFSGSVKLKHFEKFQDTTEALAGNNNNNNDIIIITTITWDLWSVMCFCVWFETWSIYQNSSLPLRPHGCILLNQNIRE